MLMAVSAVAFVFWIFNDFLCCTFSGFHFQARMLALLMYILVCIFFLCGNLVLSERLYLINSLMYIFATTSECGKGIWPFGVCVCPCKVVCLTPIQWLMLLTFSSSQEKLPFPYLRHLNVSFILLPPSVFFKQKSIFHRLSFTYGTNVVCFDLFILLLTSPFKK